MVEEILGGVESLNIFKGLWRGYAFYVTTERIIGAKMKSRGKELFKFFMGFRGSIKRSLKPLEWRGKTTKIPKLIGEDALKLLEDLKDRIDFEVKKHEIQEIELKKPGILRAGHIKIKTITGKEYKVGIVASSKEEYEYIKGLLQEFHPEKLKIK